MMETISFSPSVQLMGASSHLVIQNCNHYSMPQQTAAFSWSDIPCGGFVEELPWKAPLARRSDVVAASAHPPNPFTTSSTIRYSSSKNKDVGPPSRKASHQRHVSFAPTVQIRTHELISGDHPSCKDGLALDCGWEVVNESTAEIESEPRRRLATLLLTTQDRWERLNSALFSGKDRPEMKPSPSCNTLYRSDDA